MNTHQELTRKFTTTTIHNASMHTNEESSINNSELDCDLPTNADPGSGFIVL